MPLSYVGSVSQEGTNEINTFAIVAVAWLPFVGLVCKAQTEIMFGIMGELWRPWVYGRLKSPAIIGSWATIMGALSLAYDRGRRL